MFNFTNKTVVIIGAGSGIGKKIAEFFFEFNANVVLIGKTDKNVKSVAERLDKNLKKILFFACDVRNEKALEEVKKVVLAKFEKIDILVNSAAAAASSAKSEELSFESWKEVINTDLDGVFLACKVFGAGMIKKRYGRIINLTSFHTIATYPNRVAYNAAKSGVEGITRALAVEWGCYGVTVNAVAPGPVKTPRTSWFLSQSSDIESGMLGRTPNCRLGETEDVANLVVFLASEEAKHINGQQIVIDGGWTKCAWWGKHEKKY